MSMSRHRSWTRTVCSRTDVGTRPVSVRACRLRRLKPMTPSYWQDAAADEAMQEEHGVVWSAMLDTIDVDLTGKRVVDAGCNQGGFLRVVADRFAISEGFGYDPASGAIDDARRLAGGRPLTFEVS